MATRVRSYSKINLGLGIGAPRADGYHSLRTLYQTLELHDLVTVSARTSRQTIIRVTSNSAHVPTDGRNTAWKMVEAVLRRMGTGTGAEVAVHLQKSLPVQGGMGAGSANAAATLIGLERELGVELEATARMEVAAGVGSDVPLFLLGGSVLGQDRGQMVEGVADVTLEGCSEIACVIALPGIGVSTPAAFRAWDGRFAVREGSQLQDGEIRDTIKELSRTYSSVFLTGDQNEQSGASGIFPDPSPAMHDEQDSPEKLHGFFREQLHTGPERGDRSGIRNDLAENSLLALVRTGIENDFETVVFPQYPLLREIKRHLMGTPGTGTSAVYAGLSGSGSALFGLYRTEADAGAAQQRLQEQGVRAVVTRTMPRSRYWSEMFAE